MRSKVPNWQAQGALWLFALPGMPVVGHRSTPGGLELTALGVRYHHDGSVQVAQDLASMHAKREELISRNAAELVLQPHLVIL